VGSENPKLGSLTTFVVIGFQSLRLVEPSITTVWLGTARTLKLKWFDRMPKVPSFTNMAGRLITRLVLSTNQLEAL
jgi:hypothetical protein